MEKESFEGSDSELSSSLTLLSSPPTLAAVHGLWDHLGNTAFPQQDFYLSH